MPLAKGCSVKRLVTPAVLHIAHQPGWDKNSWLALGHTMAKYIPPPFSLTPETMPNYLNHLAHRINSESRDVWL